MPSSTTSGRGNAPIRSVVQSAKSRTDGRRVWASVAAQQLGVGQGREENGEADRDDDHATATEAVETGAQAVDDRQDEG